MQSTDQLLARIDSLLSPTNQAKTTDLHLRVMDLLDNPTQRALLGDWDCETFEETDQDLDEIEYIEQTASDIFSSPHQAERMLIDHCVACDTNPAARRFNMLFCSPYCAQSGSWFGNDLGVARSFEAFHEVNPDLPKPVHVSNLCVGSIFQLKRY